MTQSEFDRILMDDLSDLPPSNDVVASATPLDSALTSILWGMGLTVFKVEFFYLNYILPLLGACLLYLGFRSLHRENRWFRLCRSVSGALLVWHMVWDVLAATPLLGCLSRSPWSAPLTALSSAAHFVLLFSLRAGLRAAFAATGEEKPKDWLGRGILADLGFYAIAVWCTLVPLTQTDSIITLFGPQIMAEWKWLYYCRIFAAIALQFFLLFCIYKQGAALAGRGYCVTPIPVKLPAGRVIAAVFAAVLLSLPPAMYLGSHVPIPEAEVFDLTLTAQQEQTRRKLVELGLPEELAELLDGDELDACADAIAVYEPVYLSTILPGTFESENVGNSACAAFAGLETRISAWLVILPDRTARLYHRFEYIQMPAVRLQEQISLDPSGSFPQDNYTARLVWTQDGVPYTCRPEVLITGGQTADQLDKQALWWYENELERLGHLHYSPWIDFSIPKQAETLEGYVAYTCDISLHFEEEEEFGPGFYDFHYFAVRHQTGFLQYPFADLTDLGGHTGSYINTPGESMYGAIQFNFELSAADLPETP